MSQLIEEGNKLLLNTIVNDPDKVLKKLGHPFTVLNLKRNDLNKSFLIDVYLFILKR